LVVKTLTHNQLATRIAEHKGVLIVGIEALTDAKAKKTGNPFPAKEIFKHVRAVGFVGADYQNAVNREATRQGAEGNFETEKLPWGTWLVKNKIIIHNDEYYLRTQSTPNQRRNQAAKILNYLTNSGQILTREQVKPFLPPTYESAKQQDEAGLDKTVWVRTYKFNSIKKIRIRGETFKMI